jgi:hypothetical protein
VCARLTGLVVVLAMYAMWREPRSDAASKGSMELGLSHATMSEKRHSRSSPPSEAIFSD